MALKIALPRHGGALIPPPATVATEARPARSMRAADLATAAVLLALGGLVLGAALRMGIGWGSDGPESGFVPFWLATILVVSCAAILVRAARHRSQKRFAGRAQLEHVLEVLVPATLMIALTPLVGLYVAGALYMGFYMRWGGRHRWPFAVGLPLGFMVLVFLVFERWFLVPLPKGPLEAWLGY